MSCKQSGSRTPEVDVLVNGLEVLLSASCKFIYGVVCLVWQLLCLVVTNIVEYRKSV